MEDLKVGTYYKPLYVPISRKYVAIQIKKEYGMLSDTEKIDRLNKEMNTLWDTPTNGGSICRF